MSDDSSRAASVQSRVGSKQRPFSRVVLLPPALDNQAAATEEDKTEPAFKFQPQNNRTEICGFTKVLWWLKLNITFIQSLVVLAATTTPIIQVPVLKPDWVAGSREAARCAFQPTHNANTLLCCWTTNEGITLRMCSFKTFQKESLGPPIHLCATGGCSLQLEPRRPFWAGSGDCWEMTCDAATLFHPSPFELAVVPPHIPLPGFCWLLWSVPKLKTWMTLLTSGQRTSICDPNQEQNWHFKKKKKGGGWLMKLLKGKLNLDVQRTRSWL